MAVVAPSDHQERTLGPETETECKTSSLPTFFVASAFKSSLLGLLTSHSAIRPRDICIAEVEEDGEVSRLIPGAEAKRRIVNFKAAMRIHTPFVWTLGHEKKTSTFSMLFVQSAKSQQA